MSGPDDSLVTALLLTKSSMHKPTELYENLTPIDDSRLRVKSRHLRVGGCLFRCAWRMAAYSCAAATLL